MSRTIISTQAAPAAPPSYSQAVKAAGLVFVSGTAPIDPSTGGLIKGPVQAQVAQCLRNISAILTAAGSSLEKAVSATLFVADEEDFAGASRLIRSSQTKGYLASLRPSGSGQKAGDCSTCCARATHWSSGG